MDDDLENLTRDELIREVKRLRAGIRAHRDSTGHELCWHHPQLWGLLPEQIRPEVAVPPWPKFLRGCVRYREALARELPHAPVADAEFDESHADVRRAIELHNANAVRWYAAGDSESLASIFAEDAWQMAPNNTPLVGRAAIREFWSNAFKWGEWTFTLKTETVDVSGTMAVERGRYVLRLKARSDAPPGMSSFEDRGNYLVHWRQERDGEWRAVADAPVSEVPLRANKAGAI